MSSCRCTIVLHKCSSTRPPPTQIVPPPSTCAPHFPRYFLPDLFFLFSRRPGMYRAPSPTSVPVYITARGRKKPRRRRRSAHLRLAPLSVSSPPVSGVDKKTFSQSPPLPPFLMAHGGEVRSNSSGEGFLRLPSFMTFPWESRCRAKSISPFQFPPSLSSSS